MLLRGLAEEVVYEDLVAQRHAGRLAAVICDGNPDGPARIRTHADAGAAESKELRNQTEYELKAPRLALRRTRDARKVPMQSGGQHSSLTEFSGSRAESPVRRLIRKDDKPYQCSRVSSRANTDNFNRDGDIRPRRPAFHPVLESLPRWLVQSRATISEPGTPRSGRCCRCHAANFFWGAPVSINIEKRCNHYRLIVACMLSGASRNRPVIVGWSTALRGEVINETISL